MYYVYLLKLNNGNIYAGYSNNLKQRISAHQSGKVTATKKFLPCSLIFYSAFKAKNKALEFEKYLKTHSGFAFRNKRLI
jgi:putative endonuclease